MDKVTKLEELGIEVSIKSGYEFTADELLKIRGGTTDNAAIRAYALGYYRGKEAAKSEIR